MKKSFLPVCLLSAALPIVAWGEGFEAPEYQVGQNLTSEGGWRASGGAVITEEEAAEGIQSLKVNPDATITTLTHSGGIKFYQFYILPAFEESPSQPSINVAGAGFSFLKISEKTSGIGIYHQSKQSPTVLMRSVYQLAGNSTPSEVWVLVTIRVDSAREVWDLYLDGSPVAADLPLSSERRELSIKGFGGPVFLDEYLETIENPLFVDTDRDGVPDAEEKAYGLNAYGDDRDGDLDGDGISNIQEIFAGLPPHTSRSVDGAGDAVLYVDNLNGSDRNTGRHSYISIGQDGPKASLKAAMDAASDHCLIVVLRGAGIYNEGSRSAAGKSLTIKAVDPISIR